MTKKRISISLSEETYQDLIKYSSLNGMKLSACIKLCLRAKLDEENKKTYIDIGTGGLTLTKE